MEGLIICVVVFIAVIFLTDSFWFALIAAALASSALDVDVDVALQEIEQKMKGEETTIVETTREEFVTKKQTNSEKIYESMGIEKEEVPDNFVKSDEEYIPPEVHIDTTSLIGEYISDQYLDYEPVNPISEWEACRSNGECFEFILRKHDTNTIYACELNGPTCYALDEKWIN